MLFNKIQLFVVDLNKTWRCMFASGEESQSTEIISLFRLKRTGQRKKYHWLVPNVPHSLLVEKYRTRTHMCAADIQTTA